MNDSIISRFKRGGAVTLPTALLLVAFATMPAAAASGGYTAAQAAQGASVFAANCASCHAQNLSGNSGPALVGAPFHKSLETNYKTAAQLDDFISKQMPLNAPGSLSAANYLAVTAYVIKENGFAAGPVALSSKTAAGVKLANVVTTEMGAPASASGQADEIVRAAPPTTVTFSEMPAGADVDITDEMLGASESDANDWLIAGKSYANDRFSSLDQITSANVTSLVPVALVQTGITASFETTPVVVHGVMYVSTAVVDHKMKIVALNAATGARIWETTYNLGAFKICCGPVNRGVAVAYGNVYFVTLDDKLVALDAKTGKRVFVTTVANPDVGYSETMTPQVYKHQVVIGSAGGEWAIRGFVASYDAMSGKQNWRWQSTDPASFAGSSFKSGGGMVWTTPAIDPNNNLVVFSTGNPNPDLYGANRKGDNLYTDSIVGLDLETGKLRWSYQEVKHDVWDYDAVSPVVFFDVHQDGKTIAAAGEAGKVGWFFIVDRATGKLIRKSDPYVAVSQNVFSQPTKAGVDMLPGANGGAEWSPPAYSPSTHFVYVLAMDQLMTFTTQPASDTKGALRLGSAFTNVKPHGVQDGRLVAIDTETGKIAWTKMTPQPLIGGALATAGNLVFMGEGDGDFDAVDAKTGTELWHYNLGAGVNAPPVTYEVDGQQYVAVAAGGNFQMTYPLGDAIAIFKLSK
ncbi:MAG: PQQ-binding-like beta-propeller repeat protein [Candidatus Eremiobacteraeota bacterium]|nr:PQQ-binding-like beta-propeller repeat protein [Candidatus Eremiobacteraeota bacterium]